jgi:hypothetical protein
LAVLVLPILFLLLLQPPLLLPFINLVSLTCAAVVALAAWWTSSERNSAYVNLWDLSGAYAFTGLAAAMLSEPQQVMEYCAGATDVSNAFENVER